MGRQWGIVVICGLGVLLVCMLAGIVFLGPVVNRDVNDRSANTRPPEQRLRPLMTVPPFVLTDQQGAPFGTADLGGQVWVANFIFTRCGSTCPAQTAQLTDLQAGLASTPHADQVRMVSISVDPDYDQPDVLTEYAVQFGADTTRWSFLTGNRETIWELSKVGFKLGVGHQPDVKRAPIFHSDKIILVDRQMRVRGFHDGTTPEGVQAALRDIATLVAEPALVSELAGGTADRMAAADADTEPKKPPPPAEPLYAPEDIGDQKWLPGRAERQIEATRDLAAFHDFRFSDQIEASGIDFKHRAVDDCLKFFKPVHYDHGNGISVADVDSDGYLDIFFTTQVGGNEMWRNRGDGTFENITERTGAALDDAISVTSAFGDIDNDGDPDLFVTTVRGGNFLFRNDGEGRFTDISKESGTFHVGHSSGAVFFDYDNDGNLDLFVTNVGKYTSDKLLTVIEDSTTAQYKSSGGTYQYYKGYKDAFSGHLKNSRTEASILYRNLGNSTFKDVTRRVGLMDGSWTGDASPMDVNGDGWQDLYILNMQGNDEYYENDKGRRFVRKSREVFKKTPWGAMGIQVLDWDNDGLFDIFVTDMHSDMFETAALTAEKKKSRDLAPQSYLRSRGNHIMGNAFYHKQADGTFNEISDRIGTENYWPWGVSVGDLNADGYEDAIITASMNYPYRYGINTVLLNDAGKRFVDTEFVIGVEPRRNNRTMAPWFDLECSGVDENHDLCVGLNERRTVWAAVGSRAAAIFDLDNDGDLDIVTNDFNTEPMVLVSNLTERRTVNRLEVQLVGTKSNRDGLGAVVTVFAGERKYAQVLDGQSGYLSASVMPLYFGLDAATQVDRVEVQWPGGKKQTVAGPVKLNERLVVRQQ